MSSDAHPPIVPLTYSIAGCSEHSGRYVAENILVDNPTDQGSRWSGAYQASSIKQWMLLKLDQLSVLRTLTFGKFHRAHPCNMKEFKLFVGETEESMIEVLYAGLRNDHVAETFSIRHVNSAGVPFPTRYVKIVPLSAHGQSFHTSIWHIKMTGVTEDTYVQQARAGHEEYKESMILRHILKHLRQRRLLGPFQSISSHIAFGQKFPAQEYEHPIVASLHTALVLSGHFSKAEILLESCASSRLFSTSVLSFQPTAAWSRINFTNDPKRVVPQPSARGGHAMCLDETNGLIYTFGGWDGKKSLQDFWVWNIHEMNWKFLGSNGPFPRACHKLVLNEQTGDIFLFGRLDENVSLDNTPSPTSSNRATLRGGSETSSAGRERTATRRASTLSAELPEETNTMSATRLTTFCAEFYRYRTRGYNAGEWDLVSPDTQLDGGPSLVFDHQMVIDNKSQTIYVFGGRIVDGDWDTTKYSGLYRYDLQANSWTLLQPTDVHNKHPHIPARFGHSMVLDPRTETLFIFGGQRDDRYLADMYAYHIPTETITELYSNFAASGGPDACFTQRAVIDPDLQEIYVFCGLTKPPGTVAVLETEASYWVYRYERPERPGVWTKILPFTTPGPSITSSSSHTSDVPVPRFAHQVVYDAGTKTIYMHGGNAGEKEVVVTIGDSSRDSLQEGGVAGGDGEGNAGGETRYRVLRGTSSMNEGPGDHVRDTETGESNVNAGDRLDDFWTMRLQRPSSAEIVRRGKYLIRQQQFREMCEDTTPVNALAYLQTEVSSVVDHSNPEEARVFRSLLSHLLTPAPKPTSAPILQHVQSTAKVQRSLERFPRDIAADEDDTMEEATENSVDDDVESGIKQPVISFQRSLEEERLVGNQATPSPERYKQRTEIFECLMKYVNEDARQPEQNLWDMIDVDRLAERR